MKYGLLLFFLGLLVAGCIDPFKPSQDFADGRYLVVSGFLNVGSDTTTILLSRTQSLNSLESSTNETGARVRIVGDKGTTLQLNEVKPGRYTLAPRNYLTSEKFSLQINTRDGKEYASDLVQVKQAPAIDSITFQADRANRIMRFRVNTHDPNNNTWFYRWKTEETWEYTSALYSKDSVAGGLKKINPRVLIPYRCWRTDLSSKIFIGTSAKLAQDRIMNQNLVLVDNASDKLLIKYSLLVKQYALSQEAYEYWDMLARTTETTGGLFDPQPSVLTGNIHCTNDASELVFGFFSAGTEQQKRLTVTPYQLGGWYPGTYPSCSAPFDTLDATEVMMTSDLSQKLIQIIDEPGTPLSYIMAPATCADCRFLGGGLKKPVWF
ncbi:MULTISPECIES: DUF4249 domain-containing protein [unclassified Siphonobacter]|uniref:DUF4249 domain-containing protein n=1 Tax=unclassified Siphonobacter TaxID=2635712 RepID=UPI000CB1BEDA|nr:MULTISPECIES: DUF4249 domain-containing protein [unclassified Siphonobacter]MDQ1085779.1 hypothetical protein [Siphonobacter sp. SORGH_AS_1065]MDR6196047.1 hypothetical protein [Siphonobacter sp. SORGH_AS_0500]PKK35615.1 hypothetical protein BWI96_16070 [Siphonobacter sp. SORGH_AS_0500]